jgi:anaerobic magnesium-protoporphyrin IX monomethyl ester cyclase
VPESPAGSDLRQRQCDKLIGPDMDLLLTHGYFMQEDPKELQIMKPYPPLGLLYLASYLRTKDFAVEIFDSTFATRQELFDRLLTGPPGVLGVYSNLGTRPTVIEILKAAKEAEWQTVAGGPEPAAYVEEYLGAGADVIVIGEGEVTMAELLPVLQDIRQKKTSLAALSAVNGIAYRDEQGLIHKTRPRTLLPRLDDLPWPARDAIHLERYLGAWREHHGTTSLSLLTSRGCPYHCRWCSHEEVFGKTHRRRTPAGVADELEWLCGHYHPDAVWYADDVFTIDYGWIDEYAAEIKRRNLRVPFECISRANRLNEYVIGRIAELGCFRLWIGSESGSQKVLDAMQRGITLEQVGKAVDLAKAAGIETGMFLMWGYHGEDDADVEATIEHVKRTDPDLFLTTVVYPIKGTPYFDEVASRLVSTKPWEAGSTRDYLVRGRHSRRFFQHASDVLRSEVELHRLVRDDRRASDFARRAELEQKVAQARIGMREASAEVEA